MRLLVTLLWMLALVFFMDDAYKRYDCVNLHIDKACHSIYEHYNTEYYNK